LDNERGDERKRIGSRKDINQGSNDSSQAKVAHIKSFAGRKCHKKYEENLCGAYPANSGCRCSIGTGIEILIDAETITVAKCSCHDQETGDGQRK